MSRVSKEAKQKMAEIAKEDISKRLEETNKSIFPESVEYTDEYYKSTLPKKVKEKMLKAVPSENDQRLGVELVKPKRKTTNKNKK
jgi:phosphotransacetylase